jgi:hypothetical protein
MKKVFSILFAVIILITGMHLSVSRHFCGQRVSSVKWSITGKYATCEMENQINSSTNEKNITSNCCRNEVAFFKVDNNYSPSVFQFNKYVKKISQVLFATSDPLFHLISYNSTSLTNVLPPGKLCSKVLSLADLCVFRI